MSSRKRVHLKLVLVGDPMIGKSTLCRKWSPELAPQDGYHVHHSHNIVDVTIPDIRTPPLSENPANDPQRDCETKLSAEVSFYIMILQPRQEPDLPHVRLTPFVMMNTDVVGLCYNPSDTVTLENAVDKWLPFIKHHLPRTPIILIGLHPDPLWFKLQDNDFPAVTREQLQRAIHQTEVVDSVQWSWNNEEGMVTPQQILQILAWHGYQYSSESARRGCIVV